MKRSQITKGIKRIRKKTPGARLKYYFKRKQKPGPRKCAECGAELHGVPRLKPSKMRSLAKSKKTVSRPYADLCSKCMRKKIKSKVVK